METETAVETNGFVPDRKFGIEIECYGVSRQTAIRAIKANKIKIVDLFNDCRDPETSKNKWRLIFDGSLPADGFEIVSPVLSGLDGLSQVQQVGKALTKIGTKVNKRCGLHVHVDAASLSSKDVYTCINQYLKNEAIIDKIIAPSRRANKNEFCGSLEEVEQYFSHLSERYESMESIANNIDCEFGRYYKLNVAAFVKHGTLEFRQHQGTVSPEKMINWIIFCCNFVKESSKMSSLDSSAVMDPFRGLPLEIVEYFNNRAIALSMPAISKRKSADFESHGNI